MGSRDKGRSKSLTYRTRGAAALECERGGIRRGCLPLAQTCALTLGDVPWGSSARRPHGRVRRSHEDPSLLEGTTLFIRHSLIGHLKTTHTFSCLSHPFSFASFSRQLSYILHTLCNAHPSDIRFVITACTILLLPTVCSRLLSCKTRRTLFVPLDIMPY